MRCTTLLAVSGISRALAATLALCLAAAPLFGQTPAAPAPEKAPPAASPTKVETYYDLYWLASREGVDLQEFVMWMAHTLKMHIIVEPKLVQGRKVIIWGPTQQKNPVDPASTPGLWVPENALEPIFHAVLIVNNLGLEKIIRKEDKLGEVELLRLIQSSQLKERGGQKVLQTDTLQDIPPGLEYVSLVLHVNHSDSQLVYRAIINLLSKPDGYAQPISGVDAILISDYANNIQRLAQIVELIDRPPPDWQIQEIDLFNTLPSEMVTDIQDFLTVTTAPQGQPGTPPKPTDQIKLLADDLTLKLIVGATEENFQKVKKIVEQLDREIPDLDSRRVHIYLAKNQDALELADTLNEVLSGISQDQQQTLQPGQPRPVGTSAGQTAGGALTLQADQVRIVADEVTNSLIITSSADDYRELLGILEKLDIRKPQVLIEAMIVEISKGDDLTLGIEIATLDEPGPRARGFAATNFGLSNLVDDTGAAISGGGGTPAGRVPVESQGVTAGIFKDTFFQVPILMQAMANENSSNVLSVPRILTDSGEEASIVISREVPIREFVSGTTGNERENVRFEDAPIELSVRPLISEDNLRLELRIEVTDFIAGTGSANLPPQRTRRTLDQIITVPNNKLVILGGLTTSTATERVAKIPLLGDIPLLGELFKFRVNDSEQRNLYVFLTPRILRESESVSDLTDEYRGELKRAKLKIAGIDELLEDRIEDRYFIPTGKLPARQRFDLFGDGAASRAGDTE